MTEARSDDGQSLLIRNGIPSRQGLFDVRGIQRFNGSVPLKAMDRRGGKLKVLKGKVSLEIMVRPHERVVVPDLAKAQRRLFFGKEGRRLTIQEAGRYGNQWNVSLSVAGPASWQFNPKRCGFELVDGRGRTVPLTPSLSGPYPLRSPQPEDVAWFAMAPLAPSLLATPWTAFALQSRRPTAGQWQGTLWVNSSEPLEAPVRLRMFDCETLRTELPFELRDVPLP